MKQINFIFHLFSLILLGNCSTSVNPDTTPPQISIISPINGSTLSDTVMIQADTQDNNGIKSVDFYLDSVLFRSIKEMPFEVQWNTKESSNGIHTLFIKVLDISGNEAQSDTITVTIFNPFDFVKEEIIFSNSSGKELAGTLFKVKDAKVAVVMGHSFVSGESQTGLHPITRKIAELGFTALTFDFPGYGKTEGPPKYNQVHLDVKSAIDFLQRNNYYQIASLGVGLGGLGCAKMAPELSGLITISIPLDALPFPKVQPGDLSKSYPKLFIAAELDFANGRPFAQYAQTLYDYAVEPKELKIFSGRYHSMQLFESEHSEELENKILAFFTKLL